METTPFWEPRLVGGRFEQNVLPLEFLRDLSVLEEMIIEVAKTCFLKDNPDRKRSPRGFATGVSLNLSSLESGSVVPVILLATAVGLGGANEYKECFDQARDSIVQAIGAAAENRPVVQALPELERHLAYFDRFGRGLQEGEAIEFPTADPESPVRYTKEVRRRLLLASPKVNELTDEVRIRGMIPEANQDAMTFQIQLADGRKVGAPIPQQHLDTILEAFNGYKQGARVQVQGVGKFSRQERLQGIESIEHISHLDPMDILWRFDEFRTLKNGWLAGEGFAPSGEGLDRLARAFEDHFPEAAPLPFAYPTPEGGVRFEWTIDPYEISLDIDLNTLSGSWHALNLDSDEDEAATVSLATRDGWGWVVGHLTGAPSGGQL